jgi:hypothetical protein
MAKNLPPRVILPHRKPPTPLLLQKMSVPGQSNKPPEPPARPEKFLPRNVSAPKIQKLEAPGSPQFGSRTRINTISNSSDGVPRIPVNPQRASDKVCAPTPPVRSTTAEPETKTRLVRSVTSGALPRANPSQFSAPPPTTPAPRPPQQQATLSSILKPFEIFPWFSENWESQPPDAVQACIARVINVLRE